MRKIVLICILAATVSGCASLNKQAIDSKTTSELKGQSIALTERKKPDFAAMTADKAAFAIVGAFAMISAGNSIIADNKVDDPATAIAGGLSQALEAAHGTKKVTPALSVSEDDTALISANASGKARFVIDAQTINWSFGYFPTDWTHYRVTYVGKVRIIDAQSKAVIAEGFCRHLPDSNVNAPTYDELLANSAVRLKQELSAVAGQCVNQLKAELLNL